MGTRQHVHGAATVAVLAGLGIALACTLSGCVSVRPTVAERSDGESLADVRQAADRLERYGTSRTRTAVRTFSGGTRITIKGKGGFDYRRRAGRIRVTPPQGPPGAPRRGPITELVAPGVIYMNNRGAGVPAGKWVRVDTTGLPDGNLLANGATDPLSAAELLRGTRQVSYVGERRRPGGTALRYYTGTTDIRAAARASSGGTRRQLAAAAEGLGRGTVPFDAYFDRQGRLREVRHWFTSGTGGAAVVSTTRMYDFGAPVDLAMPAREDIYTGQIALP